MTELENNQTTELLKRMVARYYMRATFPFTAFLLILTIFLVSLSGSGKGIDIAGVRISPIDITATSLIIQIVQNFINQVFTLLIVMNNALFGASKDTEIDNNKLKIEK